MVNDPSSNNLMYVDNISLESRTRGKRLTEYRIVVKIRQDSDGDGVGETSDSVLTGVEVTVHFAGTNYTGVTDSNGVFQTSWISNLSSGTHQAEVTDLVLANYSWKHGLDLEDDEDGDGLPDNELVV